MLGWGQSHTSKMRDSVVIKSWDLGLYMIEDPGGVFIEKVRNLLEYVTAGG